MDKSPTHVSCEPAILYLGTPVVLNSSINEDGTYNLASISSAFWLGWHCMLGFEAVSQTAKNIIRTGECVINLPSMGQVDVINRLSRLDGIKSGSRWKGTARIPVRVGQIWRRGLDPNRL